MLVTHGDYTGVSTEFSSMEAYRDRLVHQYLGAMSQVNIKPWDPEDTIHINNVYTRLQWVQQKKTVKGWEQNALKDYCDLFAQSSEHHENPKRLLVQGKAGIGKSTFSSKLAMDWAQGKNEVLKRFELLIVLRLREVYFVKTLAEALNKCLGFEQSEAEEIIQYMGDNSDKVLLLLDGLDEYDITQSNEVLEVIHGPRLPGCLVVVTARPWMGEKIGKHMHAQFEIMGFNKEDITTYAARHFNTEAEIDSFVEYLIHNGLLPLAQIPLLLLFLCLLWKERKEEGLPSSRAELYREIIQCIIHHHNAKSSAASSDALDENAELLNRMGKIALDALKRNSLIFSYQDLAQDEQSSQILSLGLLSISKAPTRNPKVMISFLHKSVQEFLAALYITALMQSQEKEFEVRNIMDDLQLTFEYSLFIKCQLWYSENVVCFLCGLSDTGCVQVLNKLCHKRESDEIKKHLPQEFSDSPSIELYSFHKLCIEHCMSRNNRMEEVVTALVNCLKGFIAVSQSKHILNFVVSLLIEGKWKGLVVTKTKFDDLQTCAFKTLEIQLKQPGSNEHSPCADRFLQQLDVFGKEVTLWIQKDDDYTFSLLQYDINSQGCFDFCVEIDLQNDWDMDPESEEDTELIMLDIITMYPEGLCRLEDDYFGRDTITRVPFERLLRLRELRIVDQLLTAEIVHKLSVALPSMVHMQVIELKSRPDIEDGNMKKITHQLQHVTQLRKLDLRKTGMGSTSGRALVESLQHTILLEMLDLSYNPLGDNWLEGLSQHLHEIPHLRILKLRCTNMTVIGARALSGGFHCFPQLEVLDLSDNLLGDGVSSVIQNLVGTPHLQKLYLSVKRVTMSDAAANSLALPRLHQLKYLDLSNNHLCDAAVQAFAVSLCNVPQLETLKLSHAQMTGEGLMALACSLHHTPKLTDLNLSFNSFITDSEAWKKLAAELHLIPREKYQYLRLGLSGCTITGPALAELVALSHVHM